MQNNYLSNFSGNVNYDIDRVINQDYNSQNKYYPKSSSNLYISPSKCSNTSTNNKNNNLNDSANFKSLYLIDGKAISNSPQVQFIKEDDLITIQIPNTKDNNIPFSFNIKIFKIWDYFSTLSQILKCSFFLPEELYLALSSQDRNKQSLIEEVHISILNLYGSKLKESHLSELIGEEDLITLKIALDVNDHNKFFRKCWVESIKYLLTSKRYSLMVLVY